MSKHFQTATRQQISDAIETGLNAMFRELQDKMNVEDGGVAGQYDMGYDADRIREQLAEYMNGYTELERMYAPEAEEAPEHAPYSPILEAARYGAAHDAYMLTMGFGLDGSRDYGLFKTGARDEMVAKLSVTVPNLYTHIMTVEFSPGTDDVVHIALEPLPAPEFPSDFEGDDEEAFCEW